MNDRERADDITTALESVGCIKRSGAPYLECWQRDNGENRLWIEISKNLQQNPMMLTVSGAPATILGLLQPLTKEERKALEWAVELMGDCAGAKTLWNLLTRLSPQKGGST